VSACSVATHDLRLDEFSWFVGLFEGEGCIDVRRTGRKTYLRLQVQMTDEDTIKRVAAFAGCGSLYGPYRRTNSRRDIWNWYAHSDDAYRVLMPMLPHLSERRQDAAQSAMAETGYLDWASQLTFEEVA
jgi:hypothetical protein